jgi:SP family arabinose:H+ symporter-like MFS transporter
MKKKWHTVGFVCFAGSLGGLLFGFDTAVISGTIELVKAQFSMEAIMQGWFVSSGLAGSITGVIMAGLLCDKTGRKRVLLLSAVLFMLSGIGCALAWNIQVLILFRFLGGMGVGIASVASPMFIAEFAPAGARGRMISFYQLAVTIGILGAYFSNALLLSFSKSIQPLLPVMTWLFHKEVWRAMFLMMTFPSLLFIVMILLVPESPRWLLSKGKKVLAMSVLKSVRNSEIAEQEYDEIKNSLLKNETRHSGSVLSKGIRITLLTGIVLAVFQQFSGINAIIYYGPKIFSMAGLTNGNALGAQVIIGIVNMLFTWVAISWSDKFGRKPLLITGLSGIILSLFVVGFCFYTGYTDSILLLMMLLLFIACFAFSLGPVTWIIINEIFPTEIRAKGVAVCTFALWTSVWLVGQFFPWLLEHVGAARIFWIFSGCSILNLIFCLNVVVETKGKTLEEIGELNTEAEKVKSGSGW